MSVKYEILKRVVKTAGLKKMWEGKSAAEIVAEKKKTNAKNYIPELKDSDFGTKLRQFMQIFLSLAVEW